MTQDERDILETLREELDFIEKGGYGRSVKTPWKPTSSFQDSLTCINYGSPYRAHPCNECHLNDFVPSEHRAESVPCHHIPLNESGDTVDSLEMKENDQLLQDSIKNWLRAKIKEIETERASKSDH